MASKRIREYPAGGCDATQTHATGAVTYVRWKFHWTREWPSGRALIVWFWGGRGIKIKPAEAMLFSERYVWPKLRIGRYVIVFWGFGPKNRVI